MKTRYLLFVLMLGLLAACEPKIDEFKADANGVNFSKFVAIGNSLTAGFADEALYLEGQEYSFPNIIANQLKSVGGGMFTQPLMPLGEGVGFKIDTSSPFGITCNTRRVLRLIENVSCGGTPLGTYSLRPVYSVENPNQLELIQQLTTPVAGPFNNMGVPGAGVKDLLTVGYGSQLGNPFFARFASNPLTTILADALAQNPTFFSLWIGNNDVLLSALAGTDQGVTALDTFSKYYPVIIRELTDLNIKGVVANIPDINSIAFFNTIPWNGLVLTQSQADSINMAMENIYHLPWTDYKAGPNPFIIEDPTDPKGFRQATNEDLILLSVPQDQLKCVGMGIINKFTFQIYPIPDSFILRAEEKDNIESAISAFNSVIRNSIANKNLAFVDMFSLMGSFKTGMFYDGVSFNLKFIEGGLLSLDGIHLTPRGNALVANHFLDAINGQYGCLIPKVSVTHYPGLKFP